MRNGRESRAHASSALCCLLLTRRRGACQRQAEACGRRAIGTAGRRRTLLSSGVDFLRRKDARNALCSTGGPRASRDRRLRRSRTRLTASSDTIQSNGPPSSEQGSMRRIATVASSDRIVDRERSEKSAGNPVQDRGNSVETLAFEAHRSSGAHRGGACPAARSAGAVLTGA